MFLIMFVLCTEAHIRLLALVMAPTRELAIQIHGAFSTLVMCESSCDIRSVLHLNIICIAVGVPNYKNKHMCMIEIHLQGTLHDIQPRHPVPHFSSQSLSR